MVIEVAQSVCVWLDNQGVDYNVLDSYHYRPWLFHIVQNV